MESMVFGVDIGRRTVRVSAGVAEDGNVTLLGAGSCPAWGLDPSGALVDTFALSESVRSAMLEAEDEAGTRAHFVYACLPATILRTTTTTGSACVPDGQVGAQGAQRAQKAALAAVEPGFQALHQRLVRVAVEPAKDESGQIVFRATYSLLGAHERDIGGYRRAIELCGLDVESVTFAPLAAAEATLSAEERDSGAVVVHTEGTFADVVLIRHGVVQHARAVTLEWLAAELTHVGSLDRLPHALVLTGEGVDAARPPHHHDHVVATRVGDPGGLAMPPALAPGVGLLLRASAAEVHAPARALRSV